MIAMAPGKGGIGEAGDGEIGTEFLPQVKRCPVEHRALRNIVRTAPSARPDRPVGLPAAESVMLGAPRLVLGDRWRDSATAITAKAMTVTTAAWARWP